MRQRLILVLCFLTRSFFLSVQVSGEKETIFRNFMTIILFGAIGSLISFAVISLGMLRMFRHTHIRWICKHAVLNKRCCIVWCFLADWSFACHANMYAYLHTYPFEFYIQAFYSLKRKCLCILALGFPPVILCYISWINTSIWVLYTSILLIIKKCLCILALGFSTCYLCYISWIN